MRINVRLLRLDGQQRRQEREPKADVGDPVRDLRGLACAREGGLEREQLQRGADRDRDLHREQHGLDHLEPVVTRVALEDLLMYSQG